jgi:NAD-dependent deacetylase
LTPAAAAPNILGFATLPKGEPVDLERVRARVASARSVVVLTGAGVSAESGVPTFRGGGGTAVWRGMAATDLSSAAMVSSNLPLVWEWFEYRRGLLASCAPNPAHAAIAAWQDRFPRFTLVTQNIDGLHAKAGSREVIELHGNIWRGRCTRCRRAAELPETPLPALPPLCAACDAPLRPDVVLFGELLPPGAFEAAAAASAEADFFFVVGTSAVVRPAADLPILAARAGAFVVEVNPEPSELAGFVDVALAGKAGEVLPLI